MKQCLNNNWEFTSQWNEDFKNGLSQFPSVRLPHTVQELPLHYIDVQSYQMLCGYRKHVHLENASSKRTFLQLDGAAHISTIYVNGKEAGHHECGYTAYRVEITDYVHEGDNLISISLNTKEDPSVPPFGFVIDYLTYGGLYRDVWMEQTPSTYIEDIFVKPDTEKIQVEIQYSGALSSLHLLACISDKNGKEVVTKEYVDCPKEIELRIPDPILWKVHHGYLYTLQLHIAENNYVKEVRFGLRTVTVTENNICINQEPVFLRGLNRHQSFPYVGYAATASLQREDARILDEELGVNAVRTSHYPQSQYFIDECDKRGILVFTEIPGWQHISQDTHWKQICCNNVKDMVRQYRNHPSICLWGVRINESQDDDTLYTQTNAIAHALDPTRPTSGVRYLEKSSLLEDVYSYNDFSHTGDNPGCKAKKDVTPDMKKPVLISESNGHMFPTKSYDPIFKRESHALRHAKVLNDALNDHQHAGCFQWCMFDYATHKDFGSGDKICYHGVLDSFRNPKLAAGVYASQQDITPYLQVSTSMDIGDYPAGQIPSFYCFTNGDSVRLYKNNDFVKEFQATPFTALPHGPILIDDTIGKLLEEKEHMPAAEAEQIRACLMAVSKYGMANLPLKYKALFGYVMVRYHLSFANGYSLYSKYAGNWGGEATIWRFDAIKDNKVIASVTKSPGESLHLEVIPSSTVLYEGDTYDMCALRIRIKDNHDNIASYAQLPVHITASENLTVIGPDTVTAEGGMCGTYIKTNSKIGTGTITVTSTDLLPVTITIEIKG